MMKFWASGFLNPQQPTRRRSMRKNLAISVLALAVVMGMAAVASAQPGGLYVAPKLGISIMNADLSANGTADIPGDPQSISSSQDARGGLPILGLAVGYDFMPAADLPMRAELEYAWRGKKEIANTTENILGSDWNENIKIGVQSLFANAYFDLHNSATSITPYIGVGLGLALVTGDARFSNASYGAAEEMSIKGTNFAWNIGAGFAGLKITENVALDLGYRYADFGKVSDSMEFALPAGLSPASVDAEAKVSAHEVLVGVRYSF
jgi:opacity protein-like surface antigen